MARVADRPAFSEERRAPMRLHRIGECPGANGFGYFSRQIVWNDLNRRRRPRAARVSPRDGAKVKKSDSRAQRVKALLWSSQPAQIGLARSAELMHRIHQHPYMLRIHVRRHPVSKIEHVAHM